MPRMIGACLRPRCPACRAATGPDCADKSRGKKSQKAHEERQWRKEAEDEMGDMERAMEFPDRRSELVRMVFLDEKHRVPIPVQTIEFWDEHNCWPPTEEIIAAVWPDGKLRFIPHSTTGKEGPCPGMLRPYALMDEQKAFGTILKTAPVEAEKAPKEVVTSPDGMSGWSARQVRYKALEAASRVLDLSMTNSLDRVQIESRGAAVVGMAQIFEAYLMGDG